MLVGMLRAMDFSFSRPAWDQVAVVFRYLGDGPAALSVGEASAIVGSGRGVALCFEQANTQADDGAGQGVVDVGYANRHADVLRDPGSLIWYADDTSDTVARVQPYFEGARSVKLGRQIGYYGGLHVGLGLLGLGLVDGVWCANAASWSDYPSWFAMVAEAQSKAHVLQFLSHPLVGVPAGAYDYDEIYRPFPCWGGPSPDNPPVSEPEGNYIVANYTDIKTVGNGRGSYRLQPDGGVFASGVAKFFGSLPGLNIVVGQNIAVGILPTPTEKGYWVARLDGSVYSFGDAKYHGAYNTLPPAARQGVRFCVGITAHTYTGGVDGYTLAFSDGDTYNFPT